MLEYVLWKVETIEKKCGMIPFFIKMRVLTNAYKNDTKS